MVTILDAIFLPFVKLIVSVSRSTISSLFRKDLFLMLYMGFMADRYQPLVGRIIVAVPQAWGPMATEK